MKLTNRHNIPETIINVLTRPTYTKGAAHMSATELLSSPRIVQLKHKYWDNLEQDASEMVWSLFGSAVHQILEHGRGENHIIEERISTDIDGWRLSGAIDLQEVSEEGITISDYKVTSAWAAMAEKADWHSQLNIYAWLISKVKRVPVVKAQIVAIIRDWSAREAASKDSYPAAPIIVIDIPLWTMEDQESFVRARIDAHSQAHFASETGDSLPPCSSDDMWEKPTMYAVRKEKNKRATYVFPHKEEAEHVLKSMGEGYVVDVRPGERTRCERFCSVSKFCDQYHKYLETKNENSEADAQG